LLRIDGAAPVRWRRSGAGSARDALCYEHEDHNAHDLTAANSRDLGCQRHRPRKPMRGSPPSSSSMKPAAFGDTRVEEPLRTWFAGMAHGFAHRLLGWR